MTGQASSSTQRGKLFVEVRLLDSRLRHYRSFGDKEDVRARVETWIRQTFAEVKIGISIPKPQIAVSPLSKETDHIEFTGHSKSRGFPDEAIYSLGNSDLDVLVYSLSMDDETSSPNGEDEIEDSPVHSFESTLLPHRAFEGLWQSLVYEDQVGELTLRALTQAIQEQRDRPTAHQVKSWQNTVLLHGPPGSGKTTLAQALAQRLSVRLSKSFQVFKLLQISSHALFSRFYGETTKKFGELFKNVSKMASDNDQLIIIIFDEVESVAGARELIAQKNEPGETIRATNELLRGLDRLKSCGNVIFFFTSNLVSGLDPAFVDRCCIEKEIHTPSTECTFEILRMEVNSLIQQGIIGFETLVYGSSQSMVGDDDGSSSSVFVLESPWHKSNMSDIPSRQWAAIHWPTNTTTAVSELFRIAKLGKGLSGRKLKGLVMCARYEYIVDEPGDLRDLLQALEAVMREKTRQPREGVGVGEEDGNAEKSREMMKEAEDMEKFLAQLEGAGGPQDMCE